MSSVELPSTFLHKHDIPPHLLASSYGPTDGGGRDTSPASESTGEAGVAGGVSTTAGTTPLRSPSHIAFLLPKREMSLSRLKVGENESLSHSPQDGGGGVCESLPTDTEPSQLTLRT